MLLNTTAILACILQIEGVAMGSPLGPTFANFCIGNLEKSVLSNNDIKPNIYCRYVDDIFVVVRNEEHLLQLKQQLESSSLSNFTYETSVNGKMPFLDVNIKSDNRQFVSNVYNKSKNDGKLLNAGSECFDRYISSVITGPIRRAHKICSSQNLFNNKIKKLKQILINSGYTNAEFDNELKTFLLKKDSPPPNNNINNIKIYYKNQMSPSYKIDEFF